MLYVLLSSALVGQKYKKILVLETNNIMFLCFFLHMKSTTLCLFLMYEMQLLLKWNKNIYQIFKIPFKKNKVIYALIQFYSKGVFNLKIMGTYNLSYRNMTKAKSEAQEKLKMFDKFFEKITKDLMYKVPPMSHIDILPYVSQLQLYEKLFMDHLILQVKNNVSAVRV
jgi:hypothetical protein